MRKIIAVVGKPINIGRVGENDTTEIIFNLSEVAVPDATYSLIHKRHGDENSYPCETFIENGMLHWVVKNSDVAVVGLGECELLAIVEDKVAKSYIFTTRTLEALDGNIGEVPPPYQPWVDSVLSEFAFSHKLENITCHYVSIPHSAEPHCDSEETEDGLILTFYIPMGADGKDGKDGKDGRDGKDGFTPSASVTKTGSTSTITITDKVGTTSVEVKDGKDGEKGEKGDTYNLTEEDKEEIASQIHYDDSELRAEIESKADATHTLSKTDDANVPTSKAVAEYVGNGENLPRANENGFGVIRTAPSLGIGILSDGRLCLQSNNTWVNNRSDSRPILTSMLDYAVKQALTDGKGAPYTEAEKKSARERIGAEGGEFELIADVTLTEDTKSIVFDDMSKYTEIYFVCKGRISRNGYTTLNVKEERLSYTYRLMSVHGDYKYFTTSEDRECMFYVKVNNVGAIVTASNGSNAMYGNTMNRNSVFYGTPPYEKYEIIAQQYPDQMLVSGFQIKVYAR